ncbi:carboxypeptidase-like regulatory domain-containing protein [Maribacter halichondriae]|uniref:carboxypeptidase-like regulatory domain-containing protein n=1 Tax=Maribacter halichondriae TaxID=2980554 RepID=UPI002358BD49|nr:carboxypeptidase-like regulatory domain-containing protein [Maribacter sp. Hal144]
MSRIIRALFVLVCPIVLLAQESVTLSGQLLDQETQEPLPFANVAVHQFEDDALVSGAISNETGRFEILELPFGKYRLYFSFLGFETTERTLVAGGLNTIFDFGEIELAPSAL